MSTDIIHNKNFSTIHIIFIRVSSIFTRADNSFMALIIGSSYAVTESP